jgi:hypothetical protein
MFVKSLDSIYFLDVMHGNNFIVFLEGSFLFVCRIGLRTKDEHTGDREQ